MPDQMDAKLKGIVQKMIDAGESEENIASVIQHHHQTIQQQQPQQPSGQVVSKNEPGTWWGGFFNSLRPGGEVDQASMQGLGGYAQGAVADLPESMYGALKLVGNTMLNPVGTTVDLGRNMVEQGIPQMMETTKRAGNNPEAFGRMMGQMTGQPLVTEGLTRVPSALRAAKPSIGRGLENVGDVIGEHGSITGALPRFSVPRLARAADRAAGRGISNIGKSMRGPEPSNVIPNTNTGISWGDIPSEPTPFNSVEGPSAPQTNYTRSTGTGMSRGEIPESPTSQWIESIAASETPSIAKSTPTRTNMGNMPTDPTFFNQITTPSVPSSGFAGPSSTGVTPFRMPTQPTPYRLSYPIPDTPPPSMTPPPAPLQNIPWKPTVPPVSVTPPQLQLPPEFMPDVPMVSEEVLGGTSPQFGPPTEPPPTSVTELPVPTKTTKSAPEAPTQKKTNLGEFKTGEVIILPKGSVNPGRLKVLKDKGFEILEAKPNGDIRLRKL